MASTNSVHLQNFPTVNVDIDNAVLHNVDLTREICNAVFSLRKDANLRVRMPLKKVIVYGNITLEKQYIEIIKQEVNAKEVEINTDDINDIANTEIVLDLKKCGKLFGAKLKDILLAQREKRWTIADNKLLIAGLEIPDDAFEVAYRAKNGEQTFYSKDFNLLVMIEASNDKALLIEGLARDVVRMIQNTRKKENLQISDKIDTTIYTTDDIFNEVIATFGTYIKEQTLTNNLKISDKIANNTENNQYEIDDYTFSIEIKKIV